jgi:hypothetical protein
MLPFCQLLGTLLKLTLCFLLTCGHFSFNFIFCTGYESDSSCPCGPAHPLPLCIFVAWCIVEKSDISTVSRAIHTALWWSPFSVFTVFWEKWTFCLQYLYPIRTLLTQLVNLVMSLRTAGLLHRKPVSAGTIQCSCCAWGCDAEDIRCVVRAADSFVK